MRHTNDKNIMMTLRWSLHRPTTKALSKGYALLSTTSKPASSSSSFTPEDDFVPTHFDSEELLRRYIPGRVLGAGSFGNVYRAVTLSRGGNNTSPPQQVAIKAMLKSKCPFAQSEVELLQLLCTPPETMSKHVLRYIESFETETSVYIVTEYLKGPELFTMLVGQDEPFSETDTLRFVEQMLLGVEACHKKVSMRVSR